MTGPRMVIFRPDFKEELGLPCYSRDMFNAFAIMRLVMLLLIATVLFGL